MRDLTMQYTLGAATVLTLLLASGCLYDADSRCGSNQRFTPNTGLCLCIDGYGFDAENDDCVPCRDDELSEASLCVCANGLVRNESTGECEPGVAGLGTACDPGASDSCGEPDSPYCAPTSAGSGYCTRTGCVSSEDCSGSYACDANASMPYCARPPTGQGNSCTTHEDCAAFEASYCESFQTNQCMVAGCTLEPDDCFIGYECLDLSEFGIENLCAPIGARN
jgi:hypothetical protein